LLLIVISTSIGRSAPADTNPLALSEFFRPGVIFQDRNGDGVVDYVTARVMLPEAPTAAEVAAAADVAARLGFETTAMNLPLRGGPPPAGASDSSDEPTIFIGAKSLARAGIAPDAIGVAPLKAGDGVVAAFAREGKPAFAVLGGDDDGLAAAAV